MYVCVETPLTTDPFGQFPVLFGIHPRGGRLDCQLPIWFGPNGFGISSADPKFMHTTPVPPDKKHSLILKKIDRSEEKIDRSEEKIVFPMFAVLAR